MRRPLQSSDPGFTLVELLVALTLMALMSVILFGGLRFGMRAWETGSRHAERAMLVEQVQTLLRRQIGQAKVPLRASDTLPVAALVGRSDSLRFIAPLPAHRGIGGAYVFDLSLQENAGLSNLILSWQPFRPESLTGEVPASAEQTILLQDIAGIELTYFGPRDPERPAQWQDRWDGAGSTPQLVRLRIDFPRKDSRRWPDLIIRVQSSAS